MEEMESQSNSSEWADDFEVVPSLTGSEDTGDTSMIGLNNPSGQDTASLHGQQQDGLPAAVDYHQALVMIQKEQDEELKKELAAQHSLLLVSGLEEALKDSEKKNQEVSELKRENADLRAELGQSRGENARSLARLKQEMKEKVDELTAKLKYQEQDMVDKEKQLKQAASSGNTNKDNNDSKMNPGGVNPDVESSRTDGGGGAAQAMPQNPLEVPEIVKRVLSNVDDLWDMWNMDKVSRTFRSFCWNNLKELNFAFYGSAIEFCGEWMSFDAMRGCLTAIWNKGISLRSVTVIGYESGKFAEFLEFLPSLNSDYPVPLRKLLIDCRPIDDVLPLFTILIRTWSGTLEELRFDCLGEVPESSAAAALSSAIRDSSQLKKLRIRSSVLNPFPNPDSFAQMFTEMRKLIDLDINCDPGLLSRILAALDSRTNIRASRFRLSVFNFLDLLEAVKKYGKSLQFATSLRFLYVQKHSHDEYLTLFHCFPNVNLLEIRKGRYSVMTKNLPDLAVAFLSFYSEKDGKERILRMTYSSKLMQKRGDAVATEIEKRLNLKGTVSKGSEIQLQKGNARCIIRGE